MDMHGCFKHDFAHMRCNYFTDLLEYVYIDVVVFVLIHDINCSVSLLNNHSTDALVMPKKTSKKANITILPGRG